MRARRVSIFVALALGALAGCGSGAERPVNVLLVTLDTTRADRIGCYGYAAARTPALDGLARDGVRFERAYSQVPLTLPAHATLLSGVHPAGHGLRVNFQGAMSSAVQSLAELFRARGHRTGAFVAAWVLNEEFGLARGFERYDDLSAVATRADAQAERPAGEVCDAALTWLASDPERPFFAWVHFYDAHDPYAPPPEYAAEGTESYDGEIAYADAQLGRLVAWLEERGLRERTLVVVTADHGESLGEHGEATHGLFVYEATLRVPLVVSWPGELPHGAVVSTPAGLVDLHPTILALLGWPIGAAVEGRSLAPALRGEELAPEPIYAESEYGLRSFGWAPLRALVTQRWKLIEAPRPELYNLPDDPGELASLSGTGTQVEAHLRAALEGLLSRQTQRGADELERPAGATAELAMLGYVAGRGGDYASEELAGLRDPKDGLEVYRGVMRAKRLVDEGRFEEAAELLGPLVAASPESDEVWSVYAKALFELGHFEQARDAYEKSLRARPDDPERRTLLGDCLRLLGRTDEARAAYERALARAPDHAQAHSRLGLLLAQAGDFAGAERHFRRQVELEPGSANARCNLANALLAQGHFDAGLRELDAALAIDPACEPALRARAEALRAKGGGE